MRRELVVALAAGALALVGVGAGGAVQDSTTTPARQVTSSVRPTPVAIAPNADALAERGALLDQQAVIQQAKTVDLRNRIEANSRAYEARMQRELGDRAPRETIAPMETVAPMEPAP
jgi:hypothetical protein